MPAQVYMLFTPAQLHPLSRPCHLLHACCCLPRPSPPPGAGSSSSSARTAGARCPRSASTCFLPCPPSTPLPQAPQAPAHVLYAQRRPPLRQPPPAPRQLLPTASPPTPLTGSPTARRAGCRELLPPLPAAARLSPSALSPRTAPSNQADRQDPNHILVVQAGPAPPAPAPVPACSAPAAAPAPAGAPNGSSTSSAVA